MRQKQLRSNNPNLRAPLAISFGAIAGALSRYYLTLGFNQWLGTAFPFGTFFINLSGAFVMGFFTTLALERTVISPDLRLIIAVGFLGAYTTFSSYQLDAEKLLTIANLGITSLYWIGSAMFGVLCLQLGSYLARRLP
ncbi:MAG TPA: fluoride efflux transporter CrcB [Oscillatoriales bacterium UBA8482]|nr:MAG: camphor resistance protein CrcB [Oscillatoriales cyanobacterium CG2_30_40_61]HBW57318.1 fluoride efflux transporter CrcB [Oscillatoriales bacterium UBA8482]